MDDRYIPYGPRNEFFEGGPDTGQYGSGRDYTYSSARDYAAAGRDRFRGRPQYREPGDYRQGSRDYAGSYWSDGRRTTAGERSDPRDHERGFFERAGDEVRSWFGDEEAERRRARDEHRLARDDAHYGEWRRGRIAELDRDYHEYRQENAQRFATEFGNWRTERQGQRDGLGRVAEHMVVIGSDGEHLGKVDHVRGDRILLAKNDKDAGGHHHSIPSRWIKSVDDKVTLAKSAEEARNHWRDEERGALGWDREERSLDAARARNFTGTY
jgi:hypothetical protein